VRLPRSPGFADIGALCSLVVEISKITKWNIGRNDYQSIVDFQSEISIVPRPLYRSLLPVEILYVGIPTNGVLRKGHGYVLLPDNIRII
jgi:hypothetical protein